MVQFKTEDFDGKKGSIDAILDEFLRPNFFVHVHCTLAPGNLGLAKWGARLIEESGRQVLYLPINSEESPEFKKNPISTQPEGVYVNLGGLPMRYDHEHAMYGGLPTDESFEVFYGNVKGKIRAARLRAKNSSEIGLSIHSDPSILNGAKIAGGFKKMPWVEIIQYALKQRGEWIEEFDRINCSKFDNCFQQYPEGMDYAALRPVIDLFGGWIDFTATSKGHGTLLCNFTRVEGEGIYAIVQSANLYGGETLSYEQTRFVDAVFSAMKSPLQLRPNVFS
jgi:hypothetical protein